MLLVACGNEQPTAIPTSAVVAEAAVVTGVPTETATALALTSPQPTRAATTITPATATTPPATATVPPPSATPTVALAGCLEDTGVVAMPPGPLRVAYEVDGQWWEWREESGLAEPLPGEPTITLENEGKLSADGRFLLEERQPEEGQFKLWISEADGSDPRSLTTVSADEVYERYPQAVAVGLNYGWIGETSLVSYCLTPAFEGIGGVPIQTLRVADAEDGRTWTLLPADMAWSFRFSDDGRQLFALTEAGLQIVDVADGVVRFDLPLDVVVPFEQGISFTPDGSRILLYTEAGFALVNPADGAVSEIPVEYAPIGAGHTSILPPMHWLADNARLYTLTTTDDVWNNPESTFTVWLVDTATSTAEVLNSFTGFYLSLMFTPDWGRVAYWTQTPDNVRTLYLADVISGQHFGYDTLPVLEFISWSPDRRQFLYKRYESTQPILGHICAPPQPLPGVSVTLNGDIQWVDGQRLLVLQGAPEVTERPLRLISLDGSGVTIAMLAGENPQYRFYFEE